MDDYNSAWHSFVDRPADYVVPEKLMPCFQGNISLTGCNLLLDSNRLRSRLSQRLVEHYDLPLTDRDQVSEEDRLIALLTTARFGELILRSGAVFRASAIAGIIDRSQAVRLQSLLGKDAITSALRNRQLASAKSSLGDGEMALDDIVKDGWCCLHGWFSHAPDVVVARLKLKFADDIPGEDDMTIEHHELGASIVRRVASEL
ncbi:hypothetical protein F9K97_23875 [Brucella anthropi]|uniref:hypothetical protein n=1 Tax=Brucella anthropi TaxID=529 RepID=UPI00124ECDC6|nr:hypothetical protein [Brucella anthropi]KAB2736259.1 hypothetical protein F9K89_17045 [Brucella anthropi]KAB2775726.1 hypothetical protein F9K97_23875 [Brucella anthropi]